MANLISQITPLGSTTDYSLRASAAVYGVCSTAASTTAKTVTCNGFGGLTEGAVVVVRFTNTNSAANPTLNVNGSGAKGIREIYNGTVTAITADHLKANQAYLMYYDGAYWVAAVDRNNTYTAASALPAEIAAAASVGTSAKYAREDHVHPIDVVSGTTPGTVKIAAQEVAVAGLGSAAFTETTAYSASNHSHGNITNAGAVTTTATLSTTSDKILFADASDSNKVKAVNTLSDGLSVMINSLGEGTSPSNANDYIITQYAAGGTTTTSYYRRKLSNVLSKLDKYHKTGTWSGLTYTAEAVNSASALSFTIPTGTTATTVAVGNHNHDDVYAKIEDVESIIGATEIMEFKGVLDGTTGVPSPHTAGDTYRVGVAGEYAGIQCEVGDLIICTKTSSTASNSDWTVVQANIDGAVIGPASSTNGNIATFTGSTGKLIADSGVSASTVVNSVTVNGNGNAITAASTSGHQLILTKGATYNNYEHPANDGDLHVPATGTTHSGQFLKAGNTAKSFAWATLTKADISDFPTNMAPSSHTHGNITNDGKIGTTSGLAVVTGTGGAVTTANLSTADPTASGTSITFIATASTDSRGKLSVSKATVRDASASQSGVVSTGAQTFSGNKTFSNNVTVSGTTSVKSLNINGTTTATGTFTVSGPITLSGTTTIKGTTTISGATTISGNFTTSGSTVTMSSSTSITLKANEVRIQNSAGNNTQAGDKGYITELTFGDSRYTRITEYNDDDLEIRGSTILLNTSNMTHDVKAYSATTTYTVGTPVWYNSYYYVCKEAITASEAWTASHWTQMPLVSNAVMINGTTVPWKDNTYDLGSTTYKWKTVYASTFSGTANKATAANLTTSTNAVAYYSDTTGTFGQIATKSGALYATSANGTATFGTLPVQQGGTGMTTGTYTNALVLTNTTTATSAFQVLQATAGALYTTTTNSKPKFGTLPIAYGGTGATSVTQYGVIYASSTSTLSSIATTTANKVLVSSTTAPGWKGISDHTYTLPTGATSRTTNVATSTTSIYQITGVGSLPTLGTAIAADDITSWSAGTMFAASVSGEVLTLSAGTAPTLSYTARSIPNVTGVGALPTRAQVTVATGISTQPEFSVTVTTTTLAHAFA